LRALEPELFRFAVVDFAFEVDPDALLAFAVVLRVLAFFGAVLRALDVPPDEPRADEPLRLLVEPPEVLPRLRVEPLSFDSSSSELMSFFATPTAAGIATPSAVPATTFLVVDRPSSSLFDMVTSRDPA